MTANEQIQSARITEEDLIRLGSQDQFYEVTDGELVPMSPIGFEHSLLTGHVFTLLHTFVRERRLGTTHPDGLICVLAHNPDGGMRVARVPDVCFIRRGRLPKDFDLKRPFPGAPDLAIEIVSPSEQPNETRAKVRDYLRYGSEQVWVLFPDVKEVNLYRRDDPKLIRVYTGDDQIDAKSLFPGLTLKTSDLFALPDLD